MSLSEPLLGLILSYCNAADFTQILTTNQDDALTKAACLALSNLDSLHCSFLLELDRCRNLSKTNERTEQEACVDQLLNSMSEKPRLKRLELTGLRHVVGNQGDWLPRLFRGNLAASLTTIDFSGCAMLDPRSLRAALAPPRSTNETSETLATSALRHLQLQSCYRINAPTIMAITTSPQFAQLQSLGLGGCSQTIGDECVNAIITNLRHLRHLDLSGLKHITERASALFQVVPESMESLELAGCELLRFTHLLAWGRHLEQEMQRTAQLSSNFWQEHSQLLESIPPNTRYPLPNLTKINFNGIGTPRRGLASGALPYFALRSMGSLRELHLSGCEHIRDWEVQVLAVTCGQSLTCIEMRACCIGDSAVQALGIHCTQLADVDLSACFEVSDEGIIAFCRHQAGLVKANDNSTECGVHAKETKRPAVQGSSTLRSLRIAALPQLTNASVGAVAALDSLLLLDVSNCPRVTSDGLAAAIRELSFLVEVDAKGIGPWGSSVAVLYSRDEDEPKHLRFVNGRRFHSKSTKRDTNPSRNRSGLNHCIVRQHGKRFDSTQGVPLQPMYHCVTCRLIPSLNRGMCHPCSVRCHSDHQTFVGSYTRFYCDCPFGIAGTKSPCQAVCHRPVESWSTAGVQSCT